MTASDHLKQATGSLGGDQIPGGEPADFVTTIHDQAEIIASLRASLAQKTRECEELRAATESFQSLLTLRLNDHLLEMKPEHDDSIVGFNEAQDIVRKAFQEAWSVPNPIWEVTRAQVEQLQRQVAEMQWQEITESNLPKIGAEIFGHAEYEGKQWTNISSVTHVHEQWDFKDFNNCGWTHFRSINAPVLTSRARTK